MENLNAEQIVKALECCTRGRKNKDDRPCDDCPYNECNLVGGTSERQIKGTCQGWLMKDALALTKSQEQRIAELTEKNANLHASCTEFEQKCASLNDENERLRVDNHLLKMPSATIFEIADAFKRGQMKGKADTVRKMQERLKNAFPSIAEAIDYFANELWRDQMKPKKPIITLAHVEHKGYIVVQTSDYLVSVYKGGKMLLSSCMKHKRLDEDELRDYVDFVIALKGEKKSGRIGEIAHE